MHRKIAELRKKKGITQKELADRTGYTVNYICLSEIGRRNLSIKFLLKIASALEIDFNILINEIDEAKKDELSEAAADIARLLAKYKNQELIDGLEQIITVLDKKIKKSTF